MAKSNMNPVSCIVDGCNEPRRKRGMCGRHYRSWRTYGEPLFSRRVSNGGRCSVIGCERLPRSRTSLHCEVHYYRLRRNGSLDCGAPPSVTEHSHGYRLAHLPDHPLRRQSSPRVYEHRAVFFEHHGKGPFNCHVCAVAVTWDDMHVDHLNEDKSDNRIENLAAACEVCNPWRGKDRRSLALKRANIHWTSLRGSAGPFQHGRHGSASPLRPSAFGLLQVGRFIAL
jgi:hypothetical protein